jgi:hypothetical protein
MAITLDASLTKLPPSLENPYPREANQAASTSKAEEAQEFQPYRVTISEDALRKAGLLKDKSQSADGGEASEEQVPGQKTVDNAQEARELEYLKRTDREVRAHEQAHIIAGGNLVRGGASFGYAAGPDGRLYAVSGEVSIDSAPVRDDPQATIQKMQQVVRAALAPARPSSQDRAVASAALKTQAEARQEVTQLQMEKLQGGGKSGSVNIKA